MKGKKIVITALEVLGGVGAVNWFPAKFFNFDIVTWLAGLISIPVPIPPDMTAKVIYFLAAVGGVVILMKLTKQGEKVLQ